MITRAKAFGDVLLFPTGIRDDSAYTYKNIEYIKALKQLAITNDICLVDCFNYWGGTHSSADALGMLSDTVHPNEQGHKSLFDLLVRAISLY